MGQLGCLLLTLCIVAINCEESQLQISALFERVLQLENAVRFQADRITDLEKSNMKLNKTVAEKAKNINYLESVLRKLQPVELDSLHKGYESLLDKSVEEEGFQRFGSFHRYDQIRQARLLAPPTTTPEMVGFYAIMSTGITNPGDHQTLIFDQVQLNEGNGYQSHSGVFIAPASGMYAFTWTMRLHAAHGAENHSAQLIVDNKMYSAIFQSIGHSGNENVSGTCVVLLNKGDDVFVRTTTNNVGGIESDASGVTAFGGWLIK
ncbi:uncharacterized protein LOC134275936 [Saccostrea cucullata]|uniref:uncharacterized protein LOC134275936 n=1 Tax=Saccostrea cuccullata TaxID=36930 RepID=UPI002ED1F4D9